MTRPPPADLDVVATDVDEHLARQARATARRDAILGAPEAQGCDLTAFALAMRLDLSTEHAVLFLREAPPLHTAAEVSAWVEAIPHQTATEIRQ